MAVLWRGVLLGLKGLALVLGVVALAWVASNWRDEAPTPEPELLRLPHARAASPFFLALQALPTPQGVPAGPLTCAPPEDCTRRLAEAAEPIAGQLKPMSPLGERCQAALADPRYEEPRSAEMNLNTPLPNFQGAANCAKWFRGQALLAAHAGDQAQTLAQLGSSRQLLDAWLAGTESLIGRMVAASMARGHLDAVAAVAGLHPAWSADLQAAAAPWPAAALDARRWIVTERAFTMGTLGPALSTCGDLEGLDTGALLWLACKSGVGLLPNATRRVMDTLWQQEAERAQQGLDMALDHAVAEAAQGATPGLAWRNTAGMRLVDVTRPGWAPYYARQADMELQRLAVTLLLAAQAQQVPAAERQAWLDQQNLPARQRARLQWGEGGAVLQVRPWQAEVPGDDPRRSAWSLRAAV